MTPERLTALKMRARTPWFATDDRLELLAEVERLQAEAREQYRRGYNDGVRDTEEKGCGL